MTEKVKLVLTRPDKTIKSGTYAGIVLPGYPDNLTVIADRAPSIVRIEPGVVQLLSEAGNAEEKFFVGNGVAQIVDNVCTISVEKAILTQGIMLQDAVNLLENSPSESERRFYGIVVEHLIAYS